VIPPRPVTVLFWAAHRRLFRWSGGRLGARLLGFESLGLITVGRRSGNERLSVLLYLEDGGSKAVVASNAGDDRPPAWLLNIRSEPRAEILIRGQRTAVTAREATQDEFDRIWPRFVERNSDYEQYRQNTRRRIPVVLLDEASGGSGGVQTV
jgi:F420H(2)-dependent quinone reductase